MTAAATKSYPIPYHVVQSVLHSTMTGPTRTRTNYSEKTILLRSLFDDEAYKKNGASRDACIKRAMEKLVASQAVRASVKQSLRPATVLGLLTKIPKMVIPQEYLTDSNTEPNR